VAQAFASRCRSQYCCITLSREVRLARMPSGMNSCLKISWLNHVRCAVVQGRSRLSGELRGQHVRDALRDAAKPYPGQPVILRMQPRRRNTRIDRLENCTNTA